MKCGAWTPLRKAVWPESDAKPLVKHLPPPRLDPYAPVFEDVTYKIAKPIDDFNIALICDHKTWHESLPPVLGVDIMSAVVCGKANVGLEHRRMSLSARKKFVTFCGCCQCVKRGFGRALTGVFSTQ
jgi:hypothetical protein